MISAGHVFVGVRAGSFMHYTFFVLTHGEWTKRARCDKIKLNTGDFVKQYAGGLGKLSTSLTVLNCTLADGF